MIIVKVELHSAITGKITELARMRITNEGGTNVRGDYFGVTFRGRDSKALDKNAINKFGSVKNYPRLQLHVWNLVGRMLSTMGYK